MLTYSALPYGGADFTVSVGGVDYTPATRRRLSTLSLTEHRAGQSDELTIALVDHDGALALPARGSTIVVKLGWRLTSAGRTRTLVDKGTFTIDEVGYDDAPGLIEVKARSADLTGALRVRGERGWTDTTIGAVLNQIAADHGLQARVEAGLASTAIPVLAQSRESDAALLTRLGRTYDAVSTIKAGRLIFTPAASGATSAGAALPRLTIDRADGDRFRLNLPQREKYAGVTVAWHDQDAASRKSVSAGGSGIHKRLRRTYASQSDAKAAADAEWGRVKRAGATGALDLALGRPEIYPEQTLALQGFRKPEITAAPWLVTQATHTLGDQGLITALELEAAP